MKTLAIFLVTLFASNNLLAQDFHLEIVNKLPVFFLDNEPIISNPDEGLWSIARGWENEWPSNWVHASPTTTERSGDWIILSGVLELPEGEFELRDAYRQEGNKIKCIRRYEWKGDITLDKATLAIRWKVDAQKPRALLPGILYYGNLSGEKKWDQ